MSNLISPLLWQSTPYGDRDAFLDWLGQHMIWHIALSANTKTLYLATDDLGGAWRALLAQTLATRDAVKVTPGEMQRHATMHGAVDKKLGIAPAFDLVSYDLNDRDSFESFMDTHSLQHQAERKAAKL